LLFTLLLLLFLPLQLQLQLQLLLLLLLLVLRRHSERSEESPHFRGERSDPSAFLFHHPNTVISTGAAHGLIVSSGAEKPASLPIPPPNPNRRFVSARHPIPYTLFSCQAPNTITPC